MRTPSSKDATRPPTARCGPLGANECQILADALDDTPETVIPVHLLRRGLCRAYVAGDRSSFDAAIVQSVRLPEEPFGIGADHHALWDLLRPLQGWTCVDVSPACAPSLGALIREATGERVCYYDDVYHTLTRPIAAFPNDAVRRLTLADLPLMDESGMRGSSFGGSRPLLLEGFVAGAIISDKFVGTAHTSALSERHADIGVCTDEPGAGAVSPPPRRLSWPGSFRRPGASPPGAVARTTSPHCGSPRSWGSSRCRG